MGAELPRCWRGRDGSLPLSTLGRHRELVPTRWRRRGAVDEAAGRPGLARVGIKQKPVSLFGQFRNVAPYAGLDCDAECPRIIRGHPDQPLRVFDHVLEPCGQLHGCKQRQACVDRVRSLADGLPVERGRTVKRSRFGKHAASFKELALIERRRAYVHNRLWLDLGAACGGIDLARAIGEGPAKPFRQFGGPRRCCVHRAAWRPAP